MALPPSGISHTTEGNKYLWNKWISWYLTFGLDKVGMLFHIGYIQIEMNAEGKKQIIFSFDIQPYLVWTAFILAAYQYSIPVLRKHGPIGDMVV